MNVDVGILNYLLRIRKYKNLKGLQSRYIIKY